MTKEYSDYLAHHGIKGQKWGERRYQNEDGSLTPEGKKRYQKTDDQDAKDSHPPTKKEKILQKRLDENKYKQQLNEMMLEDIKKEREKTRKLRDEWKDEQNWKETMADLDRQSKRSRDRIKAWKEREKWLRSLDLNSISTWQLRKSTKLKWYEYAYPVKRQG